MTSQELHEAMIERVVRTVEANTNGSGSDTIDAAYITRHPLYEFRLSSRTGQSDLDTDLLELFYLGGLQKG